MASDLAQLTTSELLAPTTAVLFTALASARNEGSNIILKTFPVAAILLMMLAPFSMIVSATSSDIVSVILGPEWKEAGPLVGYFAWLGLIAPFTHVSSIALLADAKLKLNFCIVIISSLVKITLLYKAVQSNTLDFVAFASIGIAAIEGVIFNVVLQRLGARFSEVVGCLTRICVACMSCIICMRLTGEAWQSSLAPGQAFLRGVEVGLIGLAAYITSIHVLWRLAGRPDGPSLRFC